MDKALETAPLEQKVSIKDRCKMKLKSVTDNGIRKICNSILDGFDFDDIKTGTEIQRDYDQKQVDELVGEILKFIDSYLVTTIAPDGIRIHHIDDPEWQSVKQRCYKLGEK